MQVFKSIVLVALLFGICTPAGAQSGVDTDRVKAYYFAAQDALESNQYDDALKALDKAKSLRGATDANALAIRVKSLMGKQDYIAAKSELDRLYSMNPSSKVQREMGSILLEIDEKVEEEKRRERERGDAIRQANKAKQDKLNREAIARNQQESIERKIKAYYDELENGPRVKGQDVKLLTKWTSPGSRGIDDFEEIFIDTNGEVSIIGKYSTHKMAILKYSPKENTFNEHALKYKNKLAFGNMSKLPSGEFAMFNHGKIYIFSSKLKLNKEIELRKKIREWFGYSYSIRSLRVLNNNKIMIATRRSNSQSYICIFDDLKKKSITKNKCSIRKQSGEKNEIYQRQDNQFINLAETTDNRAAMINSPSTEDLLTENIAENNIFVHRDNSSLLKSWYDHAAIVGLNTVLAKGRGYDKSQTRQYLKQFQSFPNETMDDFEFMDIFTEGNFKRRIYLPVEVTDFKATDDGIYIISRGPLDIGYKLESKLGKMDTDHEVNKYFISKYSYEGELLWQHRYDQYYNDSSGSLSDSIEVDESNKLAYIIGKEFSSGGASRGIVLVFKLP